MWFRGLLLVVLFLPAAPAVSAQEDPRGAPEPARVQVGGVFPHLAAVARHRPRSEAGIGALMPWADRLWFVNYPAHKRPTGSGHGLYEIDADLNIRRRAESVVGTHAGRMIHAPSDQLLIGPYAVDTLGNVRVIEALTDERVTAVATHLHEPERKVYMLAMEGGFFEVDVHTLEATLLADLNEALAMPPGATAHFKGMYTGNGRVVVANNTYHEEEFTGERAGGRLAEWDGAAWTVLDENPYVEVAGNAGLSRAIFAVGWDRASVKFKVHTAGRGWTTYRLPKGGHVWDHAWNTEWMRIREIETERLLMDAHGIFYELPLHLYEGKVWGLSPVARHIRVVPDFAAWRGLLVLAGNQTAVAGGNALLGGQPQSNLWFGTSDELWRMGKPAGWGGPWWKTPVQAGAVSDPFLMTGFDEKVVHLAHNADTEVAFTLEVDFLGDGSWQAYETIAVPPGGYRFHVFPDGYAAHWIRVRVDRACTATVYFVYS